MNERERLAIARAQDISTEVLAKNAQRYDQSGGFPRENFDALRDGGLTGVMVPERFGGLGLRAPAYSLFLRILARGCASTAASFHMHNSVMKFLEAIGNEEQQEHYYGEAIRGHLFGSWGAEPSTSWSGTVALHTSYEKSTSGYSISGTKYFCSLGEGASYGLLYAVPTDKVDEANLDEVQVFIANVSSPGVEIIDEWDPLGMRATVSKPVVLTDCEVPEIARIGEPGGIRRMPTEFYGLGYATFYVAIAEAAYAWAVHYAQTRTTKPLNKPIGTFDRIQRKIGTMALHVHQGVLAVEHAARQMVTLDDPADAFLAIMKAKAIATVSALEVTSTAIEVAGGPGALRKVPLERYFRDARTATLMVPAYDLTLETVAKNELGFREKELH